MTVLLCCVCRAPAFAVKPGAEPTYEPIGTTVQLPVTFGARPIAWCEQHWPWLRQTQPTQQPQGPHPNG